ncbi:GNAT family N-acetyltransferase [Mesorhizobium sp. M0062]|uniref:GNAT family N-acetyltransferase n=1 Tax=Mesorhizobium sp. M0062 TaxID=2956867 RepID=UPI00333BB6CB
MHLLETPRLILRPPSHRDELLLHGLHSDPFVVDAIRDGSYPTIEQSRAALLHFIAHWQYHRFGLWMVFVKDERQAREFVGYTGLMCSGTYRPEDSNGLPGDSNNVEIVTGLHLAASGKGIGVEAGRAVVQFAFEHLKLQKVTAFIRRHNIRSLIKNVKVGFFYVSDIKVKNGMRRKFEVSPLTHVKSDNLRVIHFNDTEL